MCTDFHFVTAISSMLDAECAPSSAANREEARLSTPAYGLLAAPLAGSPAPSDEEHKSGFRPWNFQFKPLNLSTALLKKDQAQPVTSTHLHETPATPPAKPGQPVAVFQKVLLSPWDFVSKKATGLSVPTVLEELNPMNIVANLYDNLFPMSATASHVVAGTLARTLAQAFIHPIDTVKTRLQVVKPPKKVKKWRKKIVKKALHFGPGANSEAGGRFRINNWMYKGPGDLYLGLTGAVLGTLPTALVYFLTYEGVKNLLEKHFPENSSLSHLVSAASGAVTSAFIRVPSDTCKHRVQAYLHSNVFVAGRTIIANNGIKGLYAGFAATLLRDVPEIAIQFTVYEAMRKQFETHRGVKKLRTWEHLMLGGVAGSVAAVCTMPLDLVKTRMQCGLQRGMADAFKTVVEKHGFQGLFSGMGPRVFQVAVMSSVFFCLFEYGKHILKQDRIPADSMLIPKLARKRRGHIWKRQFVYAE